MIMYSLFEEYVNSIVSTDFLDQTDDQYRTLQRIPGLSYISEFITRDEEADLLASVKQELWDCHWQRRVQTYGSRYLPTASGEKRMVSARPLPTWSRSAARRLVDKGVMDKIPNQMGVNEYQPGQGIAQHVDYRGGTVVSLSLGSGCVMDFDHQATGDRASLWLAPRSIVVLKDEARSEWRHGIARRQKDHIAGQWVERKLRVSITFRNVSERVRTTGAIYY